MASNIKIGQVSFYTMNTENDNIIYNACTDALNKVKPYLKNELTDIELREFMICGLLNNESKPPQISQGELAWAKNFEVDILNGTIILIRKDE